MGPPQGEPPAVRVSAGGRRLGYAFLTNDVLRIAAYSGKPINSLVGFDFRLQNRSAKSE